MKSPKKMPAWMRSGRPDTIVKNCLNVQDGLVEACDFDPAMCEPCEAVNCKWHPAKLDAARIGDEDEEEDVDDEAEVDESDDDDADAESAADDDADTDR